MKAWEILFVLWKGVERRSEEEVEEWKVEVGWQEGVAVVRAVWERRGLEAGSSPAVALVEEGVRGERGEGGGSDRVMMMMLEKEGQRGVPELLVLGVFQEGMFQAWGLLEFPAVVLSPPSYRSRHPLLCSSPPPHYPPLCSHPCLHLLVVGHLAHWTEVGHGGYAGAAAG